MNIKYSFPTTREDVTIKEYQKINAYYKEAEANGIEVTDKQKLSLYLDLSMEVVSQMNSLDSDEIIGYINNIEAEDQEVTHLMTIELNGVKYGFIPDIENITIGERVAMELGVEDSVKNACDLLGVFYRPITTEKSGRYRIKKYKSKDDTSHFLNAPLSLLDSSLVFFWNLGKDLINATQKYTKEELEVLRINDLGKSGDGIKHMIHTLAQSELGLKTYTKKIKVLYSKD